MWKFLHLHLLLILTGFSFFLYPCYGLDFFFNSFNVTNPGVDLINDARIDSSVIRLTNDSNQFSFGRAFYPTRINMKQTSNSSTISSFSTSFVFSVLPEISSSPGFGLAFVLSNTTSPPGAIASQYFGLFTNNVHAWIEFDGDNFQINVTVAPIGVSRPSRPTLSFTDPEIANYVSTEMYVGFSASKTNWVEAQRVLAWSFNDTGVARDIITTNLPVFRLESSSSLSAGAIAERLVEAADDRLEGGNRGEVVEMLKLGLACCHPDPQRRPSMKEVVAVLVGEEVAAAPADLLSELTRSGSDRGCGGGDGVAAPFQDELPV
ncbi:putative carbohydrate binding protein [Tripterygium wilfordii]|uniref:Putative carbohydrate binding protein n=1 Tax=Tripterygium wilfordii TaxID=458696 RepID=A0A7J7CAX3_TRIWF|nr:putative carbohydrate binding protein [Tripterygium wilfordii]